MPRNVNVNAPLPIPTRKDGTPLSLRRFHYITETCEADPEVIAERLNARAGLGYRFKQAHFYGTAEPQAALIFERRLRRSKGKPVEEEVAPEAPVEESRPDLDACCTECALGSPHVAFRMTVEHVALVRQTGTCPNCGAKWPTIGQYRRPAALTGSEA